ncbi:hypothetical protein [Aquincola sp. J276]|uniref:hypothetical protein n=1 Tax=Aquincola sp. J276 TaxID=2898432 RepID=UPI002150E59F|nr:hypothetical protein [Aquincola sp. J276]MCR5864061.1 hypothetical protein [Aquincola sp. J276]
MTYDNKLLGSAASRETTLLAAELVKVGPQSVTDHVPTGGDLAGPLAASERPGPSAVVASSCRTSLQVGLQSGGAFGPQSQRALVHIELALDLQLDAVPLLTGRPLRLPSSTPLQGRF